ncbi:MAG: glycoside hydrolase family 130 protein [Kiritimatiellae bacterium]|jgi:predicted GH43/DUF377 family glycosyl hydrolase|nr:glycoside hydrolase family 130 protein [Kiritimatiellia bacterium]
MDIANRNEKNPIIVPADVVPSVEGAVVECVLNAGAFKFNGRIGLLMRVAERMEQVEGELSTLVADENSELGVKVVSFKLDDPKLDYTDPRVFSYEGVPYLTTISHLRLAWSDDGVNFEIEERPLLTGSGKMETFGIEDCRVTQIDDTYYLTYSAVSENGVGVALQTTKDWKTFEKYGLIFPPHNKDCTFFEEKINGKFVALHRPVGADVGGPYMWCSESPDLIHWGNHDCIARTRIRQWDCQRLGAGAAPIKTDKGWLEIYHGCNDESRYCLGAMLLDINNPTKVIARSDEPIMEPIAEYEQKGFFGNVVFTNGHIIDGDKVTIYYGASDTVICMATMSISEILGTLV